MNEIVAVASVSGHIGLMNQVMPTNQWLEWLRDPEALLWHLLDTYGVWMLAFVALIVFIESGVLFPVLPGDSLLFTLGLLHTQMKLSLWVACLVLMVAAAAGAQVGYWFGLLFGGRFFKPEARVLKTEYLDAAKAFFSKYGGPAIVLARFVPFVRTFTPIAAGMARYPWGRFTVWNLVGAAIWIVLFVVAGSLLGGVAVVRNNVELIAVIIVLVSVVPIAIGAFKKWREKKAA